MFTSFLFSCNLYMMYRNSTRKRKRWIMEKFLGRFKQNHLIQKRSQRELESSKDGVLQSFAFCLTTHLIK